MMPPVTQGLPPTLKGAPFNIARVWGGRDYPVVHALVWNAYDARTHYAGMGAFRFTTFYDAQIGLTGTNCHLKLMLTQYGGIDGWQYVTPSDALCHLQRQYEREILSDMRLLGLVYGGSQ